MSLNYEIYLLDDRGVRLALLEGWSFISYTRAVNQFGTVDIGIPFDLFSRDFNPWFRPDWRLDVWRSPQAGMPLRRESTFMLRKPEVYTRSEDGMRMLRFYGRNGLDLLRRRHVIQRGGTAWASKTDYADDMMKEIVREQMLYGSALDEDGSVDNDRAWPQGEFFVSADSGDGPLITHNFEGGNVLDVLKDIRDISFQKNAEDADNRRVYFEVEPVATGNTQSGSKLGWRFSTRSGLFGGDRTDGLEFSVENENISDVSYSINHLEEKNTAYVQGGGAGAGQLIEVVTDPSRAMNSRWNRCESVVSAASQTGTDGLQSAGSAELEKGRPPESMPLVFLSNPGNLNLPRSLYGLDWDLGDLVRVNYAGKQLDMEINLVYVSVNEQGEENITGRNKIYND